MNSANSADLVNSRKSLKKFILATGKKVKDIPLYSLLRAGNIKLPSTTAIFNMGTAAMCPSRTLGFCQAYKNGKSCCYADKAEKLYPGVTEFRARQMEYWLLVSAEQFVESFILINASKENPFKALRINESGDFWTQKCVDKMEAIASKLEWYGVKVYGYTSRQDLDFSKVKSMILSGSNFQKEGIPNLFKMILKKEDRPKGYKVCQGDCSVCNICLTRGNKTVIMSH